MIIMVIILISYILIMQYVLRKQRKEVKSRWTKVDVLLKKRNDLIPDLIETMENKSFKEETLDNVKNTRNKILSAKTKREKMKKSIKLTTELDKLFSITENYEYIVTDSDFIDIQSKLHETEDQIKNSKKIYNTKAIEYKNKINTFPFNIVATIFNFKPEEYIEENIKEEILEI